MRKMIAAIVLALTAVSVGAADTGNMKVIVNNGVSVRSMSSKAISDLFLKKTSTWSSGTAVVAVDNATPAVREEFSRIIHGKASAAVKSYWNQQIFSGRSIPPLEKASDAEVIAFVRSTPGAVGYVSNTADTSSVRVLTVE
jgi:hypothetical protein